MKLQLTDGYDASGVGIAAQWVAIARAAIPGRVSHGQFARVTATDVLAHLTKNEVLTIFDRVALALAPGAVCIARVLNAVRPLGGYGDLTSETWFTARSVTELASSVSVRSNPPLSHGLVSTGRAAARKPVSGLLKIALASETGVLRGHAVTQNRTFAAYRAG